MKQDQDEIVILENARKFMNDIKQNKLSLNLNVQVQNLTEHINAIIECKKIATPRSSILINDMLILSEHLQNLNQNNAQDLNTDENEGLNCEYSNSYQNNNTDKNIEAWIVLKETNVFYKDIKGCDSAIMDISESVIIPLKYPIIFKRSKSRRATGILLFGPPGTGKSMIARATACEISATFYTASCAELTSRWVGGSEKKLKSLFQTAIDNAPSIIFLDEIDSIASVRGSEITIADQRLTNQILIELDNITNNQFSVFVIAATNLPWQIDDAVMRRLSRKVYIPMPNEDARRSMFEQAFSDIAIITSEDLDAFGEQSKNLSGSDISTIINRVKFIPLHILYTASQFIITNGIDGNVSVEAIIDSLNNQKCHNDENNDNNVVKSTFDDIIDRYGEDSVCIPPIVSSFIFSEISAFSPTVSRSSIQLYKDYIEENKA